MKHIIGVLLFLAFLPAQAQDAQKIVSCLRGNILPGSHIQELELAAYDVHGQTHLLKGRLTTMRENLPDAEGLLRAMLRIQAPDYLSGAAYLMRQMENRSFESTYVYLPSVRRVRRVSSEFADGSLLGTNFSYYDFTQLVNAFGDLSAKFEGTDKYEDRKVDLISFSARPGDASIYSSVRVKVDQKTCVPLMAEFYKGQSVRKRFTASAHALRKSKELWYLSEIEMKDLLDDTRTVLRILSMDTVDKLPARIFEPNTFYLGD
jgi:hypothetical protein